MSVLLKVTDECGDVFEVEGGESFHPPSEVVVFLNDSYGVILERDDIKALRRVLKRVLKGEV